MEDEEAPEIRRSELESNRRRSNADVGDDSCETKGSSARLRLAKHSK